MSKIGMLYGIMTMLGGGNMGPHGSIRSYPKDLQPVKLKEPLLKIGNGKKEFKFETRWGIASVWADKESTAKKKLNLLIKTNENELEWNIQ